MVGVGIILHISWLEKWMKSYIHCGLYYCCLVKSFLYIQVSKENEVFTNHFHGRVESHSDNQEIFSVLWSQNVN